MIQFSEELTYPNEAFEEETSIMFIGRSVWKTFTVRLERGFE
jgi:hypothetical protein